MHSRVAIVGVGGVFPGSRGLADFWEHIRSGHSVARQAPADRWTIPADRAWSATLRPDHVASQRACFVEDFTLDLHGVQPPATWRDLLPRLDPMFHLLLHAGTQAWSRTNTARIDRTRCGIVIGNIALPTDASSALAEEILGGCFEDALFRKLGATPQRPRRQIESLNRYVAGLPAGVLAQALGIGAGTYTLDAACASSLYAVKLACDELNAGRADLMLAGGLSRPDSLYTQMGFTQLKALSPTGRCAPFDHKADGLVVGEGCGIVALKRVEDALRDGDSIIAVIAGVGLSNDIGGNLMLPESQGQLRAMRAAYEQAGWCPADIDHIECHGTGTPTGDLVEWNSLRELWRGHGDTRRCVIGSVKSNVGHLLTGAGAPLALNLLAASEAAV